MPSTKIKDIPKITFGIIVLNGEPFIRYNLRALYPFAHEIIVVEGASPNSAQDATEDGHSIDNTLEILKRFQNEEDPEKKVKVITRDGFWSEKDEQSRAYAEKATGSYLWQVDVDEFYLPDQINLILNTLKKDPSIMCVAFEGIHFWGGFDYFVESGVMRHPGRNNCRRIFKFGPGFEYITHRPPTVLDPSGCDLATQKILGKKQTATMGIYMYHYYAIFPAQVMRKVRYYRRIKWEKTSGMERWAEETWMNLKHPLHVFHIEKNFSWLRRFAGPHPPAINSLRNDICLGKIFVEVRPNKDIEDLLDSRIYKAVRFFAQLVERAKLIVKLLIDYRVITQTTFTYFHSKKKV